MIDRLERDPEAPPSDALAEAIVLRGLLYKPAEIARYDPSLLLVFPEHRMVLSCMRRAYARTHGTTWGRFYVEWVDECNRVRPGLTRLLDYVPEDVSRLHNGVPHPEQDFEWWWQRLRDCAEARRLIGVAQSMAEKAWRVDVAGAQQAAQSALPRRAKAIRVDV